MFSSTLSTPPSSLYGFVRLVPMIVPPRGRIPETSRSARSRNSPSTSPRQPSRMPTESQPAASASRTTARITAFSPGQSPPPVRMPTVFATLVGLPFRPDDCVELRNALAARDADAVRPVVPALDADQVAAVAEQLLNVLRLVAEEVAGIRVLAVPDLVADPAAV